MTQEYEEVTQDLSEATDDMGTWAEEQDDATMAQRLAAGRLQATGGGS